MNTWKTADAVVRITPGARAFEGGQRLLEDLEAELRVRDDVGGWAR